jgi:hypothetical protein
MSVQSFTPCQLPHMEDIRMARGRIANALRVKAQVGSIPTSSAVVRIDKQSERLYSFNMTHVKEDILRLRAEGKSYRQIQVILGCSMGTISYHCDGVLKAKVLEKNLTNRQKIYNYKESQPCVDCNLNYPYYVMQFDHRPEETKLFNVSAISSNKWETVWAEILKCDVVCANCHSIRTWNRRRAT